MRITVSSDEHAPLVEAVLDELVKLGHQVEYFGPRPGKKPDSEHDWPLVTSRAVRKVQEQEADEAVVMCWTGTGACLAANKAPGIRAALCLDAQTAAGARRWNHANVLALSIRAVSPPLAREILGAWFATPPDDDEWNRKQIERIRKLEEDYSSLQ